jgi:bifunctional non-homologous end joining protein LigD
VKRPPVSQRSTIAEPAIKSAARKKVDSRQAALQLDRMPDRVEPCLALLVAKAPTGPEWAFEVKWDGYRLAIHVEPSGVRILTRGGHDWTHRFPAIAEAAKTLGPSTLIMDGEAVVLDADGRSDFSALQQDLGGRGGKRTTTRAILYVFDLMYVDEHDISRMPLVERRHMLEDLMEGKDGALRLSEEIIADGAALLQSACEIGLEGIIAKHRDRPYRPGRICDWLKIKCIQSQSFQIVGYDPSNAMPGAVASLLLAGRRGKSLVYVGNVGTGFNHKTA